MRAVLIALLGTGLVLLLAVLVTASETLRLWLATYVVAVVSLLASYVAFVRPRRRADASSSCEQTT